MKFQATKSLSAAELMSQLNGNSDFVCQKKGQEVRQNKIEAQLRAEEKPLLAALADAGVRVNSVWDLVNSKSNYGSALPVLANHLRLAYHPKIREGIARALTVKQARGIAGKVILNELKSPNDRNPEVHWALANALAQVADISMIEEIKEMVADARYKDVHRILKLALRNLTVQ